MINIIIIFIAIGGITLVSIAEAAFYGMPLYKIEERAGNGDVNCNILLKLHEQIVVTISGLLLAHSLLSVIVSALITQLQLEGQLAISLPYLIGGYTLFQVIFCEIMGKAYGFINAEKAAPKLSTTIKYIVTVLYPFCQLINMIAYFLRIKPHKKVE